jgi:hypothetical protein
MGFHFQTNAWLVKTRVDNHGVLKTNWAELNWTEVMEMFIY